MLRRNIVGSAVIFAIVSVAGCAIPVRVKGENDTDVLPWRGRMAIQIESELAQPQSFSAGFELSGNSQTGELTLYTPLGSTAAALTWADGEAILRSQGEVRYFDSLDALIKKAVGTELPVAALFAWLAGENVAIAGWNADLSQHVNGRIVARRVNPAPVAELRLVLEK